MPEAVSTVLLDQNVPMAAGPWLARRAAGWRVVHVKELGFAGRSDAFLFEWAQEHHAVVITFDEDFADARFQTLGAHHGVVRLRVWPTTTEGAINALDRLITNLAPGEWVGALIIVDNQKIRVRRARAPRS